MKTKPPMPIIRAVLVALIVLAIGWTGLDIPRDTVEEAVDAQLDGWQASKADEAATVVAASSALVVKVIDGDTAIVLLNGKEEKLRFIGIDTPETEFSSAGAECYGSEATVRATELLEEKTVVITGDDTQDNRDKYDRLLVYVELPTGIDFAEAMVTEGFARELTFANNYKNQATYQTAEKTAKAAGRGLWGECN